MRLQFPKVFLVIAICRVVGEMDWNKFERIAILSLIGLIFCITLCAAGYHLWQEYKARQVIYESQKQAETYISKLVKNGSGEFLT